MLWEIKSWWVGRISESLLVWGGRGDRGTGVGDAAGNDGNENTHSVFLTTVRKSKQSKGRMQPGWAFFLSGGVKDRVGTSVIRAAALWFCVSLILHQTMKEILSWLITHKPKM